MVDQHQGLSRNHKLQNKIVTIVKISAPSNNVLSEWADRTTAHGWVRKRIFYIKKEVIFKNQ